MGGKRRTSFKSIAESLPAVLKEIGLAEKVAAFQAVVQWSEIVGPAIARHTRALGIEGQTLLVAVDSPAWMTQLFYLRDEILKKVAEHIGAGLVTEIRLVLKR
ncbi:MAG: DUF721 domain-containing protein [candidate division WOR-3 bacterium]